MTTKAKKATTPQAEAAPVKVPLSFERTCQLVEKMMAHAYYHQEWPALLTELLDGILSQPQKNYAEDFVTVATRQAAVTAEQRAETIRESYRPVRLTVARGEEIAQMFLDWTEYSSEPALVLIELLYGFFYDQSNEDLEDIVIAMAGKLFVAVPVGNDALAECFKRHVAAQKVGAKDAGKS